MIRRVPFKPSAIRRITAKGDGDFYRRFTNEMVKRISDRYGLKLTIAGSPDLPHRWPRQRRRLYQRYMDAQRNACRRVFYGYLARRIQAVHWEPEA